MIVKNIVQFIFKNLLEKLRMDKNNVVKQNKNRFCFLKFHMHKIFLQELEKKLDVFNLIYSRRRAQIEV